MTSGVEGCSDHRKKSVDTKLYTQNSVTCLCEATYRKFKMLPFIHSLWVGRAYISVLHSVAILVGYMFLRILWYYQCSTLTCFARAPPAKIERYIGTLTLQHLLYCPSYYRAECVWLRRAFWGDSILSWALRSRPWPLLLLHSLKLV